MSTIPYHPLDAAGVIFEECEECGEPMGFPNVEELGDPILKRRHFLSCCPRCVATSRAKLETLLEYSPAKAAKSRELQGQARNFRWSRALLFSACAG